ANRPSTVDVLLHTTDANLRGFHLPSGGPLSLSARGALDQSAPAIAVLVLATIGLMFIGLLSVGGFAVLAARRQRALGMLGALGATDRHIRLVMVANGALVGAVGALVGSGLGIGSWLAFAPQLEGLIGRRVNRFDLPWWAIGAATLLAVLTALGSAWWPARASARVSIVAALSGRPSRPQPAHRFAVLGVALLVAGPVLLALSHQRRPVFIVVGIVATTVGVLLLAPLSIRALAPVAQRAPVAVRLALRDLARYQARSGAALGAITLAVGIAATIAISAAASQAASTAATGGNLPDNHLVVYLSAHGNGSPVPEVTPAQLQTAQTSANAIASAVGSHDVLALETAVNPKVPNEPGGQGNGAGGKFPTGLAKVQKIGNGEQISPVGSTYLASPAVLAHFGINPTQIDPTVDILTSQTDVAGLQLFTGARGGIEHPKIQTVALPRFSSDPNTLITAHAVQTLGLSAAPTAWLIESPRPLTSEQVDRASSLAAGADLTVETQSQHQTLTQFAQRRHRRRGPARPRRACDDRRPDPQRKRTRPARPHCRWRRQHHPPHHHERHRRSSGLARCRAGTAGAYVALLAWYHHDLHPMRHPPVVNLLTIVIGLPLLAAICGWLLAGREPQAIARQPLE
ncbi:MAG: putative transport system permease protein, partial [Pseudonocardiales bacterium]|nr:putative transport system permease protein [Pseudonocardiales bacterium]